MLEVKQMRVYQSVRIGSSEYTYLNSDQFKMEFKPEYGCVVVDGSTLIPTNNIPWLMFKEKLVKPRTRKSESSLTRAIEFE